MSKLIFEDDDGKKHDIDLTVVKAEDITADDVVLASYEVGNASTDQAEAALSKLNMMLKEVFKESKVLTLATRHGKEDIEIRVLKQTDVPNN